MRARKISSACFIWGSLVATIELIAHTGLASDILWTKTQYGGREEDAHRVVDPVHVTLGVVLQGFHASLHLPVWIVTPMCRSLSYAPAKSQLEIVCQAEQGLPMPRPRLWLAVTPVYVQIAGSPRSSGAGV